MEHKELIKELNISMEEFYKLSGTNKDKIYTANKKTDRTTIKDYCNKAIINYYDIESIELIKLLELNKIQKNG